MHTKRVECLYLLAAAMISTAIAAPAHAVIKAVKSQISSQVHQMANGGGEVQNDVATQSYPDPVTALPVLARAKLDQLDTGGSIVGSAQVATIFTQPIAPLFLQPPSDIGLDLAAFSDDKMSYWTASGSGVETRTIQISSAELGGGYLPGDAATIRSRIVISGVMLVTALNSGQDLSGASVKFQFSVTQRRPNQAETTPIFGAMTITGGPGGTLSSNGEGVLALSPPPVVDFSGAIAEVPQVKAVIFAGLNLPYDYEIAVDEEFELLLTVTAELSTRSDGVGCAAIFGTPQINLGEIFQRSRNSDVGLRLQDFVSQHVDTTGAAYVTPAAAPTPGLCGLFGGNAALLGIASIAALFAAKRHIRPRRRRGD